MLRAQRGPTGHLICCMLDIESQICTRGYFGVVAIVLLLWLLSRSAQAELERRVPSVHTILHYPQPYMYLMPLRDARIEATSL